MKSFKAPKPALAMGLLLALSLHQVNEIDKQNTKVWETRDRTVGHSLELSNRNRTAQINDCTANYYEAADKLARGLCIEEFESDPTTHQLTLALIRKAEAKHLKSYLDRDLHFLRTFFENSVDRALEEGNLEKAKELFLHQAKFSLFAFKTTKNTSFYKRTNLAKDLLERLEKTPEIRTDKLVDVLAEIRPLLRPVILQAHDNDRDGTLTLLSHGKFRDSKYKPLVLSHPSKQSRWLYETGIGIFQRHETAKILTIKKIEKRAIEQGEVHQAGSWASRLADCLSQEQALDKLTSSPL